ncbi:Endochitinase [Komagataella phaffii CBS 7435]|uniref:Endochitinase n=1 Tax=Komagataella phaffii (strain ATCC 76273 / CBS 7435 / CECT 11047 / NRRL Y-11430 / Wegner 21-1) TaxID=981350 RepID=F2QUR1_KOMPC|nr:GQ67_04133T0 [Komagataella phaffii]AOA68250.1 GQ68_04106T0 [Komagataella phaffii GS115]CAH2449097.1 Endochitinase [Komagataella phaffii CBS 7435]CCA39139.1 Endochitinase [Komagataella phaffii CBS 7435]
MKFFYFAGFISLLQLIFAFDNSAKNNVALYWGQNSAGSQERLSYYCQSDSVDIVLLSFLYIFPANPLGLDFSNACGDQFPSGLLKCDTIAEDIQTCQSLGKKVLLSLGGATGTYGFSSDSEAEDFAEVLWDTFLGGSTDERPFGDSILDGIDYDAENNNPTGYTALSAKLREFYASDPSRTYYIAAAPQCPYPDASVGDVLANADVDFVFIQFYNNYCALASTSFNWATWLDYAQNTSPNPNVKLYVGLPGGPTGASSGYVGTDVVKQRIDEIGASSSLGGIMLWDASQGFSNQVDGGNYVDAMKSILNGLGSVDASTTSSSQAAATSQTTSTLATSISSTPGSSSTVSSSSSLSSSSSPSSSSSSTTIWWTPDTPQSSSSSVAAVSSETSSVLTSSVSTTQNSHGEVDSEGTTLTGTSTIWWTPSEAQSYETSSLSSVSSIPTGNKDVSSILVITDVTDSLTSTKESSDSALTISTSLSSSPSLADSSRDGETSTVVQVTSSTTTVVGGNTGNTASPSSTASGLSSFVFDPTTLSTKITSSELVVSSTLENSLGTTKIVLTPVSTVPSSTDLGTTTDSSPAPTASTTGTYLDCSSLSGKAKAACLNKNFANGFFLSGLQGCKDGDHACSSDGYFSVCDHGQWVFFNCPAGTACYASNQDDETFVGCNFSELKDKFTKRSWLDRFF